MKRKHREAFEVELAKGISLFHLDRKVDAVKHLENAHVLGQHYVVPHVRSHWWMLKVEVKHRSVSGVLGQASRIVLGAIGSMVGTVPRGNTGGTNISMFKTLPIDKELQKLMAEERSNEEQ